MYKSIERDIFGSEPERNLWSFPEWFWKITDWRPWIIKFFTSHTANLILFLHHVTLYKPLIPLTFRLRETAVCLSRASHIISRNWAGCWQQISYEHTLLKQNFLCTKIEGHLNFGFRCTNRVTEQQKLWKIQPDYQLLTHGLKSAVFFQRRPLPSYPTIVWLNFSQEHIRLPLICKQTSSWLPIG